MRRLIALNTIAALFVGFLYAPFFHRHDAGEDQHIQTSFIHAHFFDREDIRRSHGFESRHEKARSVDLLTTTETQRARFDSVILTAFMEDRETETNFHVARIFVGLITPDVQQFRPPPLLEGSLLRAPPIRPSFAA